MLTLILWQPDLLAKGVPSHEHVLAYAHFRQLAPLPESASDSIPEPFAKLPYSIFFVLTEAAEQSQLNWVLCTGYGNAEDWSKLSEQQKWKSIDTEGCNFYLKEDSRMTPESPLFATLAADYGAAVSNGSSGGLMTGWNTAMNALHANSAKREGVIAGFGPDWEEKAKEYLSYGQWLTNELSSVQSLNWDYDLYQSNGKISLSLEATPGTRLSKFLRPEKPEKVRILGFVPREVSDLSYGILNASRSTSYFNHFYNGTGLLEDENLKAIRSGLDALDSGFFDLWDGTWVKWRPQDSDTRLLLLGGRYVSSDLSDLFDVLAHVSLEDFGIGIRLDEENSVVGFSRIRSLEFLDTRSEPDQDERVLGRFYFCISNGCLAVAEDEKQMIELIFQLNSRQELKDSAQAVFKEHPGYAVANFKKGQLVGSIELMDGTMRVKQVEARETLDGMRIWMIKNLLR